MPNLSLYGHIYGVFVLQRPLPEAVSHLGNIQKAHVLCVRPFFAVKLICCRL